MEISVKNINLETVKSPCLVVGISDKRKLTDSAAQLDNIAKGFISNILRRGDISGATGDALMLHDVPGITAERVLLVGCGKNDELTHKSFQSIITNASSTLSKANIKNAVFSLSDLDSKTLSHTMQLRLATEALQQNAYVFSLLKKDAQPSLAKVTLHIADKRAAVMKKAKLAVQIGNAIGVGRNTARDLGNLPGNICTPTYLASQAGQYDKSYSKLKTTILNQKDMEKLGMGSLLSVARGSRTPPKLIVMEYNGGKKSDRPYVLVGKGVTFDSGGISIKPGAAMDEMKFDMCGAASVMGTMVTVNELKLPINVVAIVPSVENMPDGAATKPGDIVTSMSGQTIEILNTDAEGRLILCDALTYSEKFNPKAVIDVATLTGACVIALGSHPAGLLSNQQKLADQILAAGTESGDRAWQLPLWDDYQDQLKSNFADMANIGGREAGTVTAACFLSRFTKKLHWAHLDIAGIAWYGGDKKGASGRPVPLLTQYLLDRCGKQYSV
ncbi:MAG: leucyl aminopeptidase [Gammaproteobacteria bacterium]|nr:leucyl aminopeptidase [Gammaproteobacteria bacterium]